MIEQKVNILDPHILNRASAVCFTSNGIIKANGELVMGAGIAKQFAEEWPELPKYFGEKVKRNGNIVHVFHYTKHAFALTIVSFPTKNHWRDKSDINLIKRSAQQLVVLAEAKNWKEIYLPRPGCGYGGLNWLTVKKVLGPLLDDRFIITSF